MCKDDAINIMKNHDFKKVDYYNFFHCNKNELNNLLSKEQKTVLNRANEYKEKNKEVLRYKARKYIENYQKKEKYKERIWKK